MTAAKGGAGFLTERLARFLPLLALLMAILMLSTHIRLRVMLGDEGVACVNAWRLAMGQVPGRDFFEIIPPFSFYVLSLMFRVMGPTIVASRILAFAYGCLIPSLLLLLGRRLFDSPLARALPAALMIPFGVCSWPIPSHHWLADLLQIAALLAWLKALDARPALWSALAGVLSALSVMTLQDQGLYWIAAVSLLALPAAPREARRPLAIGWLSGIGAVLAVTALVLLPSASLVSLFQDWFLLPLTHYGRSQGRFADNAGGWLDVLQNLRGGALAQSPVLTSMALLTYALVFALPITAALSAALLWRERLRRPVLAVLAAGCLAFLGGALHRWAIMNLIWAAAVPSLLVAALADLWLKSASAWKRRCAIALTCPALCLFLLFGALRSYQVTRGPLFQVESPAGNLTTTSVAEARSLQGFLDAIESQVPPRAPAFIHGFVPLVGFLSGHPDPTRFTVLLTATGYNSRDQGLEWMRELDSANIQWGFGPRWTPVAGDPADMYLAEKFEPAWENGSFVLWRRRQSLREPSKGDGKSHG